MGTEEETRVEGVGHDDRYTPIMLDKPRRLLLNMNAMVDFEKATNKQVWDMGENLSVTDMRALLWACLRHEELTLTPGVVGEWIDLRNWAMVCETIAEMMTKNMPDEKKGKKKASPLA